MERMERRGLRLSLVGLLLLVALSAVNFWLFRWGLLAGFIGLNVSKHVAIAVLCQQLGIDRRQALPATGASGAAPGPGGAA